MTPFNNVTLVVPIYADWATLEQCILSLIQHVRPCHRVLLINDSGPEADAIERKILQSIDGLGNFSYFRNPENLGFVKTCNRAVFELDPSANDILILNSDTIVTSGFIEEMQAVLDTIDRHAVVCPRSNKATLLSVPLHHNDDRNTDFHKSYAVWKTISTLLPRFQKIPTAVGFCMLIKRELITNFGLFDEIYGQGYHEENDFCSRINRFGYSTIMANRAFVFHHGERSFGKQLKDELGKQNKKILNRRYPEYELALSRYYSTEVHPVDHFADVITGLSPKKKILFCLYNLPCRFNGTSELQLSLLYTFAQQFGSEYEIHVLTNKSGDEFHNISRDFKTFYIDNEYPLCDRYDLAIIPAQIFDFSVWQKLNHHALKVLVIILDIICWRSNYLDNGGLELIGRYTVEFADRIITISDFTKRDLENYYGPVNLADKVQAFQLGVNQASAKTELLSKGRETEFVDYILIVGNHFKHKAMLKALESAVKVKYKFVVLGLDRKTIGRQNYPNIQFLESGFLSEQYVESLYANARLIVFPSLYEGFGLPIAKANLYHRPILAFNTEVNQELANSMQWEYGQLVLFDDFNQLAERIIEMLERDELAKELKPAHRTWLDYASDIRDAIEETLHEPLDFERLQRRWDFGNLLTTYGHTQMNSLMHGKRKVTVSFILDELVSATLHPVKSLNRIRRKTSNLLNKFVRVYQSDGLVESVQRVKNYFIRNVRSIL